MREMQYQPVQPAYVRAQGSGPNPAFQEHSFNDQQAALTLTQFARRQNEIDVDADNVTKLVYALTAEADGPLRNGAAGASEAIFNAMGTNALGSSEREQLINVRKLIDMYLGSTNGAETNSASSSQVQPPIQQQSSPAPSAPSSFSQLKHLDVPKSKPMDVRSDGGFESHRLSLDSAKDERGAQSAPSSRSSSRRATRSSRRSTMGTGK